MDTITSIGHNSRIPAFTPFFDRLDELKAVDAEAAFDYEDASSNKAARSHIHSLRLVKGEVERTRKKEKEESLAYGRRVDEQAKAITTEIEALIARHDGPIKAIEQREKDRVAEHEAALAELEGAGRRSSDEWQTLPLDAMRDRLAEVEAADGRDWEEFANRAAYASKAAAALIREAIAKREAWEAERAETERKRKEAEERERQEREARIAREAEERATAEAETRARAEREAAERRERGLKEAAERAERDRAAAEERAKRAAAETEERMRREAEAKAKREAEEAARREANKRHRAKINNAAVAAFVAGGLSEIDARGAVTLIATKAIPAVTITY